jgi:hypothetical protein
MKQESKLTHSQSTAARETNQTDSAPLEFQTTEELLRHDAAQVELPPSLLERIRHSVATEKNPWWRRLFP